MQMLPLFQMLHFSLACSYYLMCSVIWHRNTSHVPTMTLANDTLVSGAKRRHNRFGGFILTKARILHKLCRAIGNVMVSVFLVEVWNSRPCTIGLANTLKIGAVILMKQGLGKHALRAWSESLLKVWNRPESNHSSLQSDLATSRQ